MGFFRLAIIIKFYFHSFLLSFIVSIFAFITVQVFRYETFKFVNCLTLFNSRTIQIQKLLEIDFFQSFFCLFHSLFGPHRKFLSVSVEWINNNNNKQVVCEFKLETIVLYKSVQCELRSVND